MGMTKSIETGSVPPPPFDPQALRAGVPEAMQQARRWLVWRALAAEDPAKKPRKVPFYADGSPRRGALDTAEDQARLVILEQALAAVRTGPFTGVGFALGPDGSGQWWQGIDFDQIEAHPALATLVGRLPGYVEVSPSGQGVHAVGLGAEFAALGSNASGIEAYSAGRYFTVTGAALRGAPEDLAPFVAEVLVPVHGGGRASRGAGADPVLAGESFFAKVNAKALASLRAWVPALLPAATEWREGYRISSRALGRELEEDLQILPEGIMDFGEERGRSPIDLVIDWGPAVDAISGAHWLCERLGVDPARLGWSRPREPIPPATAPEDYGIPPGKPALKVVGGTDHDPRPVIEIEDGRLPENVDAAAAYLMEAGIDVYQHGNRLVRVGRWEAATGLVDRPTGAGVLIDLSPEWMVDAMTRRIQFKRYDKRQEKMRRVDCPSKVAKTLLARAGEWPFFHLLGFCDSPTLVPDGRVVADPGFDQASGLFLSCPPAIRPIGRVSAEDRDWASKNFYSLFDTFPFASDADAAAAMAMGMTGLMRRVLPSSPIACVSASTPATGKSLLADCISALMTGRRAPVAAIGKDSEELEKRIDSILLKGDPICVFDNVMRAVSSDVLCQVATQPHKSIRVLAQSRIVEAPTNVFWVMTGNNLTLLNDLTRRVLVCNLDAGCERPELRQFARDAVAHVLAHRAEGIRWALMISKAYLDAGCPDVGSTPFGSFELWDRMVRRPLIWAGWPDPLGPAAGMREQDQEFDAMADLMRAWAVASKGAALTAAELYALITEQIPRLSGGSGLAWPELHEAATTAFGDLGRLSPKDLGYRLRQWSGRILGGMRIVPSRAKTKHGRAWIVEMVTTGAPV